jgi:hypothetical protein
MIEIKREFGVWTILPWFMKNLPVPIRPSVNMLNFNVEVKLNSLVGSILGN